MSNAKVFTFGDNVTYLAFAKAKRPSIKYDSFNMVFFCPENYSLEQRQSYVNRWYRKELRKFAEPLILQWAEKLQVQPNKLLVSTMKTKWGSCNSKDKNIRFKYRACQKSPNRALNILFCMNYCIYLKQIMVTDLSAF